MRPRRARDALAVAALALLAADAVAQSQTTTVRPSLTVKPAEPNRPAGGGDLYLQLEVFVNERPLNLISAFQQQADGTLASTYDELDEIGLRLPARKAGDGVIRLTELPGVSYRYDDASQSLHILAPAPALKPRRIAASVAPAVPAPTLPPWGALLNYTLFASADETAERFTFDGVSAGLEGRLFGPMGLVESSGFARIDGAGGAEFVRLDTRLTREDPARLRTLQLGDLVTGGFSWTRPVRMGGVQLRRSFRQRPDLVTVPVPTLSGSAAAPSTLELYVNQVRSFQTEAPAGPFELEHPPLLYGGGTAQLVLRDALGRETITTTPFYASPELLAPGLTDYSLSLGMARRNYAVQSADYDGRLAGTASARRGITERLTLQGHTEATSGLVTVGAGAVMTAGNWGLASAALSGSRDADGSGVLLDLGFESRLSSLSLSLRTLRTFGDYQDLASWTAAAPPLLTSGRRHVFGHPRELDHASVSAPLPWRGGSVGASFVLSRREEDVSKLLNLSYTQDFGRVSLFASVLRDFATEGSDGMFVGLSLPLGREIRGSAGVSQQRGRTSAYAEASRHGHHEPGELGWTVRAAAGESREIEAIARYGTRVARFEAGALHTDRGTAFHGLAEGAVAAIGGGLHFVPRLDDSFALVEVGAPGVEVSRENRVIGRTNARGQILAPNLAPFTANQIAIDPAALPLDAEPSATSAVAVPFSRSAVRVDLRVKSGERSALLGLVDEAGRPIVPASELRLAGRSEPFVIGYDGQVFIDALGEVNEAVVTTPDGASCRATFSFRAAPGEQVRLDGVVCRASS